jgi:hypothetical protein
MGQLNSEHPVYKHICSLEALCVYVEGLRTTVLDMILIYLNQETIDTNELFVDDVTIGDLQNAIELELESRGYTEK